LCFLLGLLPSFVVTVQKRGTALAAYAFSSTNHGPSNAITSGTAVSKAGAQFHQAPEIAVCGLCCCSSKQGLIVLVSVPAGF
jgi:S-methylmethionine-dependent homocysteine/selenocysteine methylase